jgi:hypothetical protein
MGIQDFRAAMVDIPGGENVVMSYEDGGEVQVFSIGDVSVRAGPNATPAEIRQAFLESKKE